MKMTAFACCGFRAWFEESPKFCPGCGRAQEDVSFSHDFPVMACLPVEVHPRRDSYVGMKWESRTHLHERVTVATLEMRVCTEWGGPGTRYEGVYAAADSLRKHLGQRSRCVEFDVEMLPRGPIIVVRHFDGFESLPSVWEGFPVEGRLFNSR